MSRDKLLVEWSYLTAEAQIQALKLMEGGIRDQALAMEIVIAHLGDAAFDLEDTEEVL